MNNDIAICKSETKFPKNRKRQNLVFQSQLRLWKFLTFIHFWKTFRLQVTLKTFLWIMDNVIVVKVFIKLLSLIRALKRTLNYEIMIRRRKATLQKKMQKRWNLDFWSQPRFSKFLTFINFLKNFSTSGDSNTFLMGNVITFQVVKTFHKVRAL